MTPHLCSLALVFSLLPSVATAASPQEEGRLTRLTPRSFIWVSDEDRSANGALFIGSKAALAVDPGLTPVHARRFLEAARKVSDRPIRWVVLTHWHPDHSLGAVCLEGLPGTLLAHPQARRSLAEQGAQVRRELGTESACHFHLPDPVLQDRQVFDLGGHRVEVWHPGPAHTAGDLVVWSAAERVLATGDLFLHDACPDMGEASVRSWIAALSTLVALRPLHVIPGHFAPGNLADLQRFRSYLLAQRDHAAAALSRGATVDQVAAQANFPEFARFRQLPRYHATIADNARAVARELSATVEVAVLGMIHGEHRKSARWGLDAVRQTLRRLAPDVVCAEIPPDRWPRIWQDFAERGVFEDTRIKVFPEYTDVLLPLAAELGFTIEPCAAWTKEMSDLREERLRAFDHDPAQAARRSEYERRTKEVAARHAARPLVEDDPRVIHSPLYDARTKEELSLYDQYLNDYIGPGGWTNINTAHFRLIDQALRRHRGKRVVITFGAGHKYWFLEQLRARPDVKLVDVGPYLP